MWRSKSTLVAPGPRRRRRKSITASLREVRFNGANLRADGSCRHVLREIQQGVVSRALVGSGREDSRVATVKAQKIEQMTMESSRTPDQCRRRALVRHCFPRVGGGVCA